MNRKVKLLAKLSDEMIRLQKRWGTLLKRKHRVLLLERYK